VHTTFAPVLVSAFVSALAVFIFTAIFFHLCRGLTAMKCLYLAWLAGALVWLVLLSQLSRPVFPLTPGRRWDLLCGALILGCSFWGDYWLANLGGGFRVLMLLDLADAGRPLTQQEWMDRYGGGRGMNEFLSDRLRSILVPLKVVSLDQNDVILTSVRGRILGLLVWTLSLLLTNRTRHA
jgi:hypothetical protein